MEYKGYTIEIVQDEHAESPRTAYDNLGTMICRHSRYTLGDDNHGFKFSHNKAENYKRLHKQYGRDCIQLPLYLLDHSGLTMSTTPFNDHWDSMQVGIIIISRDTIRKEYGVERISPKLKKQIIKILKGEVETYDHYLTGNVHGYQITKDGEDVDSCWGYYGDEKYCREDAESVVDAIVKHEQLNTGVQQELLLVA